MNDTMKEMQIQDIHKDIWVRYIIPPNLTLTLVD